MPGRPEHSGLCDDDVAPQGEILQPRPQAVPNRSPARRVRFGEDERRNERVLPTLGQSEGYVVREDDVPPAGETPIFSPEGRRSRRDSPAAPCPAAGRREPKLQRRVFLVNSRKKRLFLTRMSKGGGAGKKIFVGDAGKNFEKRIAGRGKFL